MNATTRQRLLLGIGGAGLLLAGAALATAAGLNWASLDDAHRTFVILLGTSAAAVGGGMIIMARPGGVTFKALRRLFILIMGLTVILIGVALLVLPGPGWVIIFAGLGILATEFAFARRILNKARDSADYAAQRIGISERLRRRLKIHSATRPSPPDQATPEGSKP